jgi:2-keto-4-pentenoate hydratase/2-oxohepta-3-ene-1,7-dioic acid hydratase in catechol pathway
MSTSVLRTSDAWWVESGGLAQKIDTTAATTAELLDERDAIAAAADSSGGTPVSELELVSPVTRPCRIIAQMVNFRSHAKDSGFDPDNVPPTFFRKSGASMTGPTDTIVKPEHVKLLDYEVELGLVMGAPLNIGDIVTPATLPDWVAGLVVTNDVSARDVQLTKTQFYEGKSYPTFTPVGPKLVLLERDEFRYLDDLRLTLSVNRVVRQDSTMADMIVPPARALTLLARFQELSAGDLLLTGTPGGTALKAPPKIVEKLGALIPPHKKWEIFFKRQASNPDYLVDGDAVTATIKSSDGVLDLGTQTNGVKAS